MRSERANSPNISSTNSYFKSAYYLGLKRESPEELKLKAKETKIEWWRKREENFLLTLIYKIIKGNH